MVAGRGGWALSHRRCLHFMLERLEGGFSLWEPDVVLRHGLFARFMLSCRVPASPELRRLQVLHPEPQTSQAEDKADSVPSQIRS